MRAFLGAVAILVAPSFAMTEEVIPWGSRDFSARRIGVPSAGARTALVQIDPNEEPYFLTPARPSGAQAPRPNRSQLDPDAPAGWFWSAISPAVAAGSPDRLARALDRLRFSDPALVPGYRALAGLARDFGDSLAKKTRGTRVSPALALAVMAVESAGNPSAVSSAGAQGLMQLMPVTAERFDVTDPFEPEQNIAGGVAYLDFLLQAFGDDPILALAAYNAGEGSVASHSGVPPFAETRRYVPKVLAAWSVARSLCRIPPQKVTDPCDFRQADAGGANG